VGQGVRGHPHLQLSTTDPVEYIKSVTGGNGADVCIEAIGNPTVYKQAFEARDLAGTVVLVGVPRPDMTLELPFIEVFGRGGALKSSWYGDCLPSRDFPMLVTLHQQGRPAARQVRQRDHLARCGRGGFPQDGAWRGAAQRGRVVRTAL
jgi:Zn-dependent alcohol dehydrogenase